MGELLALKWEDIDFSTTQLHVRRTINRLAKYEAHDGENKTEIVFGTPKTKKLPPHDSTDPHNGR